MQVVQFPFQLGLNEAADPKELPPGSLLVAENCAADKAGRLVKRNGTRALSKNIVGGGTLSSAARLVVRGDELAMIDGTSLYAWTGLAWKLIDAVPNVGLTWRTLLDTFSGVAAVDCATDGTHLVTAWITGDGTGATAAAGDLWVQVMDPTGAAISLAPTRLFIGNQAEVRVLIIGTKAIVLSLDANLAKVVGYSVDLNVFTVSAGTALESNMVAGGYFDAVAVGGNFVLAAAHVAVSSSIAARLWTPGFALLATTSLEIADSGAVSCDGAVGESVWISYATSGGLIRLAAVDAATLAITLSPVTVRSASGTVHNTGVVRVDAVNCIVASTDGNGFVTAKVNILGTVSSSSTRGTYSTRALTRPFPFGGRFYALITDLPALGLGPTFQGVETMLVEVETAPLLATIYTTDFTNPQQPHRYVGKVDTIIGGRQAHGQLANVVALSATNMLAPVPFLATAPARNSNWRQGARLVSLTIGASLPDDMWRSASYGQEAYIAGPVLAAYDGRAVFDYAFVRPLVPFLVGVAGGAGSVGIGSYIYQFVREFRSAAGVLHRSAPSSAGIVVVPGASSRVTFSLINANTGRKQGAMTDFGVNAAYPSLLAAYRSVAGGPNAHRLTYEPLYNVVLENDPQNAQPYSDGRADTDIDGTGTLLAGRPVIYTTGGVLDDEQPPALLSLTYYRGRLWGIDGGRRTIWFSKSFQDDIGAAPGFSTSFRLIFDQDLVALAVLDEKFVALSRSSIWFFAGEGPAPDGSGSDISTPVKLQGDVGCTNARSLVSTPDGVFFQSTRGIEFLARGLTLTWVGRVVQDELAVYPSITSAVLVPDKHEVRFTCNRADGTAGIVLAFDYVHHAWFTRKYTDAADTLAASTPIADAALVAGAWTFVTPGGQVYQESAGAKLDAGTTWITRDVQGAWLSPAGKLAWHRIRAFAVLGTSVTDHDLEVSLARDYAAAWMQTKTFQSGTLGTQIGPIARAHLVAKVQKIQAIRFRLRDLPPSGGQPVGNGDGPIWEGFGLEVAVKTGLPRMPAPEEG